VARPSDESAAADLFEAAHVPQPRSLSPREIFAEAVLAAAFLTAALAIGLSFDAAREWRPEHAVVLTLLFALALRMRFDVGAGWTQPVQLVFVPMLLLLPTPWVPMLVLAGFVLERIPELLRGMHPTRLLLLPVNAWFAIGPALVLVLGHAQTPDWSDWPIYLAALAAQFVVDLAAGEMREWLGRGIAPRLQLRMFGVVPLIDALLSPLGLLAAFASESFEFAYLLLVPPAGMLQLYSSERSRRVAAIVELVEAEREALRAREALVAGASHEILTPLAVVTGLVNRLAAGGLEPERQAQALSSLRREMVVLRHLSRQFVDYTRLKAGQPLTMRARDTDVGGVIEDVAAVFASRADIRVEIDGAAPVASVDPDRLQQMLMILVSNAVKYAAGTPVSFTAAASDGTVRVAVRDEGPGIPDDQLDRMFEELSSGGSEGAGIGLYLCRAIAEAQDAEVDLESTGAGGSTFAITLPVANG
jgi:signal transduction histidine kinase